MNITPVACNSSGSGSKTPSLGAVRLSRKRIWVFLPDRAKRSDVGGQVSEVSDQPDKGDRQQAVASGQEESCQPSAFSHQLKQSAWRRAQSDHGQRDNRPQKAGASGQEESCQLSAKYTRKTVGSGQEADSRKKLRE